MLNPFTKVRGLSRVSEAPPKGILQSFAVQVFVVRVNLTEVCSYQAGHALETQVEGVFQVAAPTRGFPSMFRARSDGLWWRIGYEAQSSLQQCSGSSISKESARAGSAGIV